MNNLKTILLALFCLFMAACTEDGPVINESIDEPIILQSIVNPDFDTMLQDLLDHSVPQVYVLDIITNDAVLLDTRVYREYEVSHIKGATWVGYDEFTADMVSHIPKTTPIITYCSVGYRSEKIGEELLELGYEEVHNFYGGIFEWVNQEQTVYDVNESETLNVHAFDEEWGVWLEKGVKVYE